MPWLLSGREQRRRFSTSRSSSVARMIPGLALGALMYWLNLVQASRTQSVRMSMSVYRWPSRVWPMRARWWFTPQPWALAHLRNDRSISALIGIRRHTDPDVRHAVAFGMGSGSGDEVRQTLIQLMEDQVDEVRNWATFGLGSLSDADGPEVREALRKRLDDSFEAVRDEAIWGLARRKDPSALQSLLKRLESGRWVQGDEDAAAEVLGLARTAPTEKLQDGLRKLLGG